MHFDFISFSFAVAAQQINHHTTQTLFFFPPLHALCLLHIINHGGIFFFSCCPLIESSSQLYVTKAFMSANTVNKNRTLTARAFARNQETSGCQFGEETSADQYKKAAVGEKVQILKVGLLLCYYRPSCPIWSPCEVNNNSSLWRMLMHIQENRSIILKR